MKRRKSFKAKMKKGLILSGIFVGAVFMASAYSLLTRTLTISGTANLYSSNMYLWRQLRNNNPSGFSQSTYNDRKYIFADSSPNNYLSIDNGIWRIVSVESDNTVKIVSLDGVSTAYDLANNRTVASTYCEDVTKGCNSLIQRSTLTNGQIEGAVENNSTIHSYMASIYNLAKSSIKAQIAEHSFNVGPVEIDNSTTLANVITQEEQDSYIGYFGLLSLSDFIYPTTSNLNSTVSSLNLDYNWLTNATDTIKWTGAPVYDSSTNVWAINYDKTIKNVNAKTTSDTVNTGGNDVTYNYVLLPVAYLKSTAKILSGTGTQADPYVLEIE